MGSREDLRIEMDKMDSDLGTIIERIEKWKCDCEDICKKNIPRHNALIENRSELLSKLKALVAKYIKLMTGFAILVVMKLDNCLDKLLNLK